MPSPWAGDFPSKTASKALPTKTVNHPIVEQVKAAVENSDHFKRADELKQMIDHPTAFKGGREWSPEEKNELKQAEADYKQILSEKINIKTSLDGVNSLFDEKSRQSTTLSEDARSIAAKLDEIASHLSQYEEKLKLLGEKDNKTEKEIAWETEARKQILKLKSEQVGLGDSLDKIQSLQRELNDAEEKIAQELEKLLGSSAPGSHSPSGPQSAAAVNGEMAKIKGDVFNFSGSVNRVCDAASQLLGHLFESIKNISSNLASQFKSANATLAESSVLLNDYPAPTLQVQM